MLLDVSEERQWGLVLTGMVKLQENAGVALSKGESWGWCDSRGPFSSPQSK